MSQRQRAGRCLAEEAALRFWPFAAIGESVVRGHVASDADGLATKCSEFDPFRLMCREREAEGT